MNSEIHDGYGALELGNAKKAEEHFQAVLGSQGEVPCLKLPHLIEAHNGMGAVNFAHRDLMEARRWYHEAKYMLNELYHNEWPAKLTWDKVEDHPAIRNLMGHAHVHYAAGELDKAREYYETLLECDKRDELGVKRYLAGIKAGKHFDEA